MHNEKKEFISDVLTDLQIAFNLSDEAIKQIRKELAYYALAAVMDSKVRQEAENICAE